MKANDPVARWLSTAEMLRQATVYTPPTNGLSGTVMARALSDAAAVGPLVTDAPLVSRTLIVESLGSGRSPKESVTSGGDVARMAPGAGSDDWSRAWPCAGPTRASAATRASVTTHARVDATILRPTRSLGNVLRPPTIPASQREGCAAQDDPHGADHDSHEERRRRRLLRL